MPNRTLTDADLDAISDKVVEKLENKFLLHVAKGFMKYVWAGAFSILLYLAASGYAGYKGH